MIRIVKLSGKYYGYDISDLSGDDLLDDINGFLNQSDPVLLVDDLWDAKKFGVDKEDIKIIKKE